LTRNPKITGTDELWRIKEYNQDYLHINNVNFAGQGQHVCQRKIDSKTNGKDREVTIDFRNPYPASDCNWNGGGFKPLSQLIRVYVPEEQS
jgi:hypothetical protein